MSIIFKASFFSTQFFCLFLGIFGTISFINPSYGQMLNFKNGTIKVCSDAGFLPFEMKNNIGKWEGFDIEMMDNFAKSLNSKIEMVQINFDGIIPALLSGKCDIIAAGMTVTPSRAEVVAFSNPTFENGLSIAVKNSSLEKSKYTTLESLDKIGIKIAVKTGYTSDIYLTKVLKKAQVLRFDQDTDLYLAVMQGRAEAFVSDATYVSLIIKENPNKLTILHTNIASEKFSVAARKKDEELMKAFNQFLEKWNVSAERTRIYNKYFKS